MVGYIGETIGWHYGFGLAGIGMALGQLTYWYGQKYLTHVGNLVIDERDESEKTGDNLISSTPFITIDQNPSKKKLDKRKGRGNLKCRNGKKRKKGAGGKVGSAEKRSNCAQPLL